MDPDRPQLPSIQHLFAVADSGAAPPPPPSFPAELRAPTSAFEPPSHTTPFSHFRPATPQTSYADSRRASLADEAAAPSDAASTGRPALPALTLTESLHSLPTPLASPDVTTPPADFPPRDAYSPFTATYSSIFFPSTAPPLPARRPVSDPGRHLPRPDSPPRDRLATLAGAAAALSPPFSSTSSFAGPSRSRSASTSTTHSYSLCDFEPHKKTKGAAQGPLPKRFACRSCTVAFARRNDLLRHERTHTGETPFECRRGCNKRFKRSDARKRHEEKGIC
ncbi:hypothetical protein JCM10207_006863 [Rhodosporidiobolus poonsookiae]